MLRTILTGAILAVFLAPSASAARPTILQAERAVQREVSESYPIFRYRDVGADCRRLTTTRFKCSWLALRDTFNDDCMSGYCTVYRGRAYATRYRYSWDVRLYSVRRES